MGARTSRPDKLEDFVRQLEGGSFDDALRHITRRSQQLKWEQLPDRIIFLRHGQSEGNINRNIYSTKGDAHLELTPMGLRQAESAGERMKNIVGADRLFVVVSPFERAQQTLLGLYRGGLDAEQVGAVHVMSQIREQEFGNFQQIGMHEASRAASAVVGRFYYRRTNAESSADVYDRVSAFWDELLHSVMPRHTDAEAKVGTCLIVTHGLTLRLALMKVFQWSVETFETVWNVENCEHVTLRKNMDKLCYQFDREESYPQVVPWATRPIWVVLKSSRASRETEEKYRMLKSFKDGRYGQQWQAIADMNAEASQEQEILAGSGEGKWLEIDRVVDQMQNARVRERSVPYTVLDYLTLTQPRTVQTTELNGRVVEGHKPMTREEALKRATTTRDIDWDDVEMVDWWGPSMSYQGKMLRMGVDDASLPRIPSTKDSFTRATSHGTLWSDYASNGNSPV